jgi:hypothetical protein
VERAKPVVSATFTPLSRSAAMACAAPSIGAQRPASTSSAYARSKAALAAWARCSATRGSSPAHRCRKTLIFDSPMVRRT